MALSLPPELITLFGSSLVAGTMKMIGSASESRRLQTHLALASLGAQKHRRADPSLFQDSSAPGYHWTRLIIALIAVFFVIAFPKIIATFFPHIPIHVGYSEIAQGFLFFSSNIEKIHWIQLHGLTITPLDTHLLAAIIGFYFGGTLINRR